MPHRVVKSDYEIVSYDNEQSKQTNIIMQNEIIYDGDISMDESIEMEENSTKMNKCTVRLTRIDPETIEKFEYYSVAESTEEQMISIIPSRNAESKIKIRKDSQINASLKIKSKIQNDIKCHICGKTYKYKKNLKRHIRDHHNTPKPSCDLCGKSFSRKGSIRRHMHTYHMNTKFSCYSCSAEFESSAKLCDHRLIAHCKYFKCEECDAAFGKACLLSEHVKAMHDGKRWYCQYQECSTSFSLRFYAIKHLKAAHSLQGEEMINNYLKTGKNDQSNTKCQICGMIAKNKKVLYEHFLTTHSDNMRFSCDLCGQTFSHKHKIDLIDHMYKHQLKAKLICNLCSAEFQSNLKFIFHEKNAHNKKFKCETCDASFIEVRRLKEHVKVQHEGKRYHCPIPGCSISFSSIESARMHLNRFYKLRGEEYRKYSAKFNPKVECEREDDFKCQICSKIFMNRTALSSHFRLVHNKNMSCDFCGKTFSNKRILIDHMQTHHIRLKFKCDLCSLEFRSNEKLKAHRNFVHNKNNKCDKCNLAFSLPNHLKKHVKVKHERKRYHCSYPGCSVSVKTKLNAANHLVVAHSLVGDNFIKFNEKLMLQ